MQSRTADPRSENVAAAIDAADFPHALLAAARDRYAADVRWYAPRRNLVRIGRDAVISQLLRECAAMHAAQYMPLRRAVAAERIVDEYAVRFTLAGEGIEAVAYARGERIELGRLRVLELRGGCIVQETCIETWTLLPGV